MTSTTIADVRQAIRGLYHPGSFLQKLMVSGRPFICPLHSLVDIVRAGSSVLDVGCGNGMFLNLLGGSSRISRGVGFDASAEAIATATQAARKLPPGANIRFEVISVEGAWPEGMFDVVSMIDVLHHIPPPHQRAVVQTACAKVAADGIFLYKDMGTRSTFRALANRAHDLVLARQWIHYASPNDVSRWAQEAGLTLVSERSVNMLWYEHDTLVFRKAAAG